MANPLWPEADIDPIVFYGGWSEKDDEGFEKFAPEDGVTKRRPKFSKTTTQVKWQLNLDWDQRDDLLAFYRVTLKKGVLRFDMKHPINCTTGEFQFVDAPTIVLGGGKPFTASLNLIYYPE